MDKRRHSDRTSLPAAAAAAASASSITPYRPEPKAGKFQSGTYDKPVVLIGCSGPGDELVRLATSLVSFLAGKEDSQLTRPEEGRVIQTAGKDDKGTWALSPDDVRARIEGGRLSRSHAIVIDFDSPFSYSDTEDETDTEAQLTSRLTELARSLYEDEGLLCVYVNVHPDSSGMSANGRAMKARKERDIFIQYSDYEITVNDEGTNEYWSDVDWELSRLIARAVMPPPVPGASFSEKQAVAGQNADLTMGVNTFFLSIVFKNIMETLPYVEAMCRDVDAMEFRADLLDGNDDRFHLLHSLQKLRRMCRPYVVRAPALPLAGGYVIDDAVPVVFTVRTAGQAGTFPDDPKGIARMFDLLELGLRSGVEVLDVESGWDADKTDRLLSLAEAKYTSNILGSYHVVPNELSMEEAVGVYERCTHNGRSHAAKVVLSIEHESNHRQAYEAGELFVQRARERGGPVIPYLGLILGEVGQESRVLNERFAPVTHESLPFVAAPGQLTSTQIMSAKILKGLLRQQKYAIIGHNIAYSVSPAMHSAAFAATKLPHSYSLIDVENVEDVVNSDFWQSDDFGGLSVTIPHKQSIVPYLDELSEAAEKIGAVNTVIASPDASAEGGRILKGENTDWRGIYNPLRRRLGETSSDRGSTKRIGVALILGAGGTARAAAYAAAELGLQPMYYNRTPQKAEELAVTFGGFAVSDLSAPSGRVGTQPQRVYIESNTNSSDVNGDVVPLTSILTLGDALERMNGELRVVISTLPNAAEFVLPDWIVKQSSASKSSNARPPIIFDVNYKPYTTKLLEQAENAGFETVRGSEMLWEQGVGQFELWTGRMAPYKVMKGVVLENCLPTAPVVTGDYGGE